MGAAVERLGHRCTVAEDGDEAWRAYQADPPEVVITDWQMPGTRRHGARRARSATRRDADYTYVIVLTGAADEESARATMEAGADDLLLKPLDPAQLERKLIAAERVTAMHRRLHDDARHDALDRARQPPAPRRGPRGRSAGVSSATGTSTASRCSTSTTSRATTTAPGTCAATTRCAPSPARSSARSAAATPSTATAARSSSCCCPEQSLGVGDARGRAPAHGRRGARPPPPCRRRRDRQRRRRRARRRRSAVPTSCSSSPTRRSTGAKEGGRNRVEVHQPERRVRGRRGARC